MIWAVHFKDNMSTTNTGIGFSGLLTVAFIVLKLTNYISWSWWWVISPIWIPVSIFLIVIIISFLFAFLMEWGQP